ncbi:MAG: hypothetical protein ACI8V2_003686, partial [Candidatus Latescibacterota bacterium]
MESSNTNSPPSTTNKKTDTLNRHPFPPAYSHAYSVASLGKTTNPNESIEADPKIPMPP